MTEQRSGFEGWAILELMGHRRLAGHIWQEEIAGVPMLRIDMPGPDGVAATQFYSGQAVYCITPTTEEIARAVALHEQPRPVQEWELHRPRLPAGQEGDDDDREDGDPEEETF